MFAPLVRITVTEQPAMFASRVNSGWAHLDRKRPGVYV